MLRRLAPVALSVLALGACGGQASTGTPSTSVPPATTTSAAPTTAAPTTSTAPVTRTTATAEEPCPYLDEGFVMQTAGQHLTRIVVTTTTPPEGPVPQCDFYRSSDEVVASVRTVTQADPVAAQDAAVAALPGGNPVSDVADGGVVLVGSGTTSIAVSKGAVLVTVTINQESSLEARTIAGQVVTTF